MGITNDGLEGFERDLKRRLQDYDGNRDQLLNEMFNLTIANKAIVETILVNQAKIFGHLFQEKTAEQHFEDFKRDFDTNQAKVIVQVLTKSTEEQ